MGVFEYSESNRLLFWCGDYISKTKVVIDRGLDLLTKLYKQKRELSL